MSEEVKSATPLIDAFNDAFEAEVSAFEGVVGEAKQEHVEEAKEVAPAKVEPAASADERKPEADPAKGGNVERTEEEKSAVERARTALRRDKVPANVLDAMDEKALVEWGLSRAKVQGDVDDAFRQLSELKRSKETAPASTESAKTSEPAADQPADWEAKVNTLRQSFSEDEVNAIAGMMKDVIATVRSEHQREITAIKQSLAPVTEATTRSELRHAREKLSAEFPDLKDEGQFKAVTEKMEKLLPSGAYESFEDLMRESSLILFGSKAIRDQSNRSVETYRSRDRGLPNVASTSSPRPVSKQQRALAEADAIFKKHGL